MVRNLVLDQNLLTWICKECKVNILEWSEMWGTIWVIFSKNKIRILLEKSWLFYEKKSCLIIYTWIEAKWTTLFLDLDGFHPFSIHQLGIINGTCRNVQTTEDWANFTANPNGSHVFTLNIMRIILFCHVERWILIKVRYVHRN